MSAIESFIRLVRARSEEHERAVAALAPTGATGPLVSILRQELDSMVRVIYLLHQPREERDRLLAQLDRNERWSRRTANGKWEPITDATMVDLAHHLHGWTRSVYKYGCAFVHLSVLHDHATRDPLGLLSQEDRDAILDHMGSYHRSPKGPGVTFDDLRLYLPAVFRKVRSNLACYLRDLERGSGPN